MRLGRFQGVGAVLGGAVLALAGCSGPAAATHPTPEHPQINVGVLPVVDDAPAFIAQDKGYFTEEGLNVKLRIMQGPGPTLQAMNSGGLDVGFIDYVTGFDAEAKGTGKYRVLNEGYQAQPGVVGVVTLGGQLDDPAKLTGKTIAVNTIDQLGTLAVSAALQTHQVDARKVHFKAIPFPLMPAALARGEVDAAWMVEPFITDAAKSSGARLILDAGTGPTAEFPIAGYFSTQNFSARYPKTAAAFTRAIHRAQLAAADRGTVEQVLPSYTRVDSETAVISSIGDFPASDTPSPVRLQRVADLMQQFGVLTSRLDVKTLLQ